MNCNTQNAKIASITEKTLIIGIDVGSETHFARAFDWRNCHYWFALGAYLQGNGMRPVHVNPHHVKKSKEMDDNNPSKNDRKDPKTIAALVNEGRFSYPYIPTGIHAEIRSLSNLRFQTQEEITRIKNRIARWFSIYFPEYKDVYRDLEAASGMMILKTASLPADIKKLGVEGVNKIWREAKLRGAGHCKNGIEKSTE